MVKANGKHYVARALPLSLMDKAIC